jgi:TolA-binding protein
MTNFEEKIRNAEERISELNTLINYWRKQNDLKRESKESSEV